MVRRILLLCVLGCIACGDDDNAGPQCNVLLSDVCDRAVACVPQQVGTHASCLVRMQQILACESAGRVSATYDRCIQQIEQASCPALFPTDPQTATVGLTLPADCTSAIQRSGPSALPSD